MFPALVFMANEIPQEPSVEPQVVTVEIPLPVVIIPDANPAEIPHSFIPQPFFLVSTSFSSGATLVLGALRFNLEEIPKFRSLLIAVGLMDAEESTVALGDSWDHPAVLQIIRTFRTALFMRANYTTMTLNVFFESDEYTEFRLPNPERFFKWSSRMLEGNTAKEAIEAKTPEFLAYFKQLGENILREALRGPFAITEDEHGKILQLPESIWDIHLS